MSAYICNPEHISALAAALVELGLCEREIHLASGAFRDVGLPEKLRAAQLVGEDLHISNCLSVVALYGKPVDTKFVLHEQTARELLSSRSEHPVSKLPALRLIKAAQCYRHQASEHRGWDGSKSDTQTEVLINRLTRLLPGYDEAAWGW